MLVVPIDEHRHALAARVVDASADERKTLIREIVHERRLRQLAREPRAHRVAVARNDIDRRGRRERAPVAREKIARKLIARGRTRDPRDDAARDERDEACRRETPPRGHATRTTQD